MSYVIEVLRQEHCNIESLLGIRTEVAVFDREDIPPRITIVALIDYQDYPDSCITKDLMLPRSQARGLTRALSATGRASRGAGLRCPGRSAIERLSDRTCGAERC
jgi:hypothetical protein